MDLIGFLLHCTRNLFSSLFSWEQLMSNHFLLYLSFFLIWGFLGTKDSVADTIMLLRSSVAKSTPVWSMLYNFLENWLKADWKSSDRKTLTDITLYITLYWLFQTCLLGAHGNCESLIFIPSIVKLVCMLTLITQWSENLVRSDTDKYSGSVRTGPDLFKPCVHTEPGGSGTDRICYLLPNGSTYGADPISNPIVPVSNRSRVNRVNPDHSGFDPKRIWTYPIPCKRSLNLF